ARRIPAPRKKIRDGALRPVAIPDDQRELFLAQFFLHARQRIGGGYAEDAFGGEIALDRPADKVVRTGIADVLHDRRIDVAQIDETPRQGARQGRRGQQQHQDEACTDQPGCHHSGPSMPHRGSQNSFTAAATPLLMMSRRSAESILSSSSRLMIEPASSSTAAIFVFRSTISSS